MKRPLLAGIAGLSLLTTAVWLALGPSDSRVMNLTMTVETKDSLVLDSLRAKIVEEKKSIPSENQGKSFGDLNAKEETLQWRCNVRNNKPYGVRLLLGIEFLDADGFLLAKATYDSNTASGDLEHLAKKEIYQEISVSSTRAKKITQAKVIAVALQTDEQVAAEEAERRTQQNAKIAAEEEKRRAVVAAETERMNAMKQEAERAQRTENERRGREEQERQAASAANAARQNAAYLAAQQKIQLQYQQAEAQRQLTINAEVAKWKKLRKGMKKDEVEALLGKPSSVQTIGNNETWTYPSVPGDFTILRVDFLWGYNGYDTKSEWGIVQSWTGPSVTQL